jgi:hypothetical protein
MRQRYRFDRGQWLGDRLWSRPARARPHHRHFRLPALIDALSEVTDHLSYAERHALDGIPPAPGPASTNPAASF